MSRYYGSVTGSAKTEATRQGSARSGIRGHIRGWRVGAEVRCRPIGDSDRDQVEVEVTGGSGSSRTRRIATLRETLDGVEVVLFHPRTGTVVARHELDGAAW